jgi:CcmD family protein
MEDNLGYFLAAYIVIWVVLFAYVYRIYAGQRNLKREIDSLKEELRNKKTG